ncbi:papilin-like [Anopheles aquasalis]|uniref:papilin-like n=1 Tax=Anopheles aquasalis TaxID=42839 RepID=UPI00215ABE01|nr:papilin-like [Anopheles aquasalis]
MVSGGISENFIIPGGEGLRNDRWSDWSAPSPCSRPCGGGIAYQERECLNTDDNGTPDCTGGTKKYFSCNTQHCPEREHDFRKQQCSEFNDVPFEGHRYQWIPYTSAPNPCELNCMRFGEQFYYRHRSKVIDGTRCNDGSLDVCVDGTCQPVGCDMMLGSQAKEDKCRVCRGDGSSCKTVNGLLDQTDLKKGYNDLLLIPSGATNVVINERAPSKAQLSSNTKGHNYLAIRNLTGFYHLNGNNRLDFPRTIRFAGCYWHYERRLEGFAASDRLTCLGPTTESVYLVLLTKDRNVGVQYEYSVSSAAAPVDEPHSYSWMYTEFQPCTVTCGGGVQSRHVTCNSKSSLREVDEALCNANEKPATTQKCGQQACPHCHSAWNSIRGLLDAKTLHIGYNNMLLIPSGAINVTINAAVPTRHYLAVRNETGYFHLNGNRLIDSSQTFPFAGCNWQYEKGPDRFGAPDRLTCLGPTKDSVYLAMIIKDTNASIHYEYSVLSASESIDENCSLSASCIETKYGCCPDGLSPATGPKDQGCPKVDCVDTLFGCCPDNETPAKGNDHEECPIETTTVAGCVISLFGCCDDGSTEGKNPKSVGCPGVVDEEQPSTTDVSTTEAVEGSSTDVSSAENTTDTTALVGSDVTEQSIKSSGYEPCTKEPFGCCPDGKTPAHGHNREGCCVQSPYGCCPDNVVPAQGPNQEGCECEYSPYGCCPDNKTSARGYGNAGCGCQYTEHGCCPDKETEALGPNYKGCPCHAYQFGCCPDGVTQAKGPHNHGCHCSHSEFKCCSDGQTVAKGPDGEGCTCAESKYGCCPDGITEAQGSKFEGCTDVPESPQKACALPKDKGPCDTFVVKHFFEVEYGGCGRFWYGGCDGNKNRFDSADECKAVCETPPGKDVCHLPKITGPCTGHYNRWYYDAERNLCSQFTYGGCLGNDNRFEKQEDCKALCSWDDSKTPCEQPMEHGPCNGTFERWYYDKETVACQPFSYGGCKGNKNNYRSEASCNYHCKKPGVHKPSCSQRLDVGNCEVQQARWYFAGDSNKCMPFYFTGCGGNDNNYVSRDQCEAQCPPKVEKDTCFLPAETGECQNFTAHWYFDTKDNRCRQFFYGGCGGNGNNFVDEPACINQCIDGGAKQKPTETEAPKRRPPEPVQNVTIFPVTVAIHFPKGNNVDRNSNFTINCTVDGYPKPKVSWLKNGKIMVPTERIHITDENLLVVTGAIQSDNGQYKCLAKNEHSEAFQEQILHVEGIYVPPGCTDNQLLAKCDFIVAGHLCTHKHYKKFCCRSCTLAGQINVSKKRT